MSRQVVSENPKLMLQWDFEKNKGLDPSQITGGSEKKAWWKCGHGHSWIARISSRYVSGCPYCTGKKAWPGFNDIPTTHPHIADEWDYEKNSGLKPEDFTAASNKKVWWNCRRGHSWLAMINKRKCGRGCPYCAGRKLLVGFNDLVTTHSLIAVQWDYNKNDDARPEQFMAGSNTRAWWK